MKEAGPKISQLQLSLISAVFNCQPAFFKGLYDSVTELYAIDRFRQVIICTLAQAFKRHLDVGYTGNHNDTQIRIVTDKIGKNSGTVTIRQTDIKDDECDPLVFNNF